MRRYSWSTETYYREDLSDLRKYQAIMEGENEAMVRDMRGKDVFGQILILLLYKLR